jgi:predicted RNase H-like HicB family nuclease
MIKVRVVFMRTFFVSFRLSLNMIFTAIIEEGENGWLVGQIEEVSAAISQGKTLEDLRASLIDAVQLILETKEKVYICV